MPKSVQKYRCLIISPSDVPEERQTLMDSINRWNAFVGQAFDQVIEPVAWGSHAVPSLGGRPQGLFNRTVDDCDLGIAVFWSRLGTPTGDHSSGSVEEIERLKTAGKPVLVYFSEKPIPVFQLSDASEYPRLAKFREGLKTQGILQVFSTPDQLGAFVISHLTRVMQELSGLGAVIPDARGREGGAPSILTAPAPDVRLKVGLYNMMVPRPRGAYSEDTPMRQEQSAYIVTVENHSPVPVFLSSITLELDKPGDPQPHGLFMAYDLLGQSPNQRIEPGNSFQFAWGLESLLKAIGVDKLKAAVAVDKVGRRFETAPGEADAPLRKRVSGLTSR